MLKFPLQFVTESVCRQVFFVSSDTLCGAASGLEKVVMPVQHAMMPPPTLNTPIISSTTDKSSVVSS